MSGKQPPKTGPVRADKVLPLFLLLWVAYFTANLGRQSFICTMAEIIRVEGLSNAAAGLVGTGFFVCYGLGQLLSGWIGDRLAPGRMELCGLAATAAANLLMGFAQTSGQKLAVWCFNGLAQAMLWVPILRIISEYFPPDRRKKASINMATPYPVAALVSYAAFAGIVQLAGWRAVFFVTAALLAVMAAVWGVAFGRLGHYRQAVVVPPPGEAPHQAPEKDGRGKPGVLRPLAPMLLLFCGALVMQGVLRDGVTAWVPAYIGEVFSVQTTVAILLTALLPVFNLAGIWLTNLAYRFIKSEAVTALLLFSIAAVASALLLAGRGSLPLTVVCFAIITACMIGSNVMFIHLVPTYFVRWGRVAFVSGLFNFMMYFGSSISSFGIGALADALGWWVLLVLMVAVAAAGALLCLALVPLWRGFLRRQPKPAPPDAPTGGRELS